MIKYIFLIVVDFIFPCTVACSSNTSYNACSTDTGMFLCNQFVNGEKNGIWSETERSEIKEIGEYINSKKEGYWLQIDKQRLLKNIYYFENNLLVDSFMPFSTKHLLYDKYLSYIDCAQRLGRGSDLMEVKRDERQFYRLGCLCSCDSIYGYDRLINTSDTSDQGYITATYLSEEIYKYELIDSLYRINRERDGMMYFSPTSRRCFSMKFFDKKNRNVIEFMFSIKYIKDSMECFIVAILNKSYDDYLNGKQTFFNDNRIMQLIYHAGILDNSIIKINNKLIRRKLIISIYKKRKKYFYRFNDQIIPCYNKVNNDCYIENLERSIRSSRASN
jgi:hypothetical protein